MNVIRVQIIHFGGTITRTTWYGLLKIVRRYYGFGRDRNANAANEAKNANFLKHFREICLFCGIRVKNPGL